jgi:anti-sigma factor RsiW
LNHDEQLLDLYLDGALDSGRRFEIAMHLLGCPFCSDYVAHGESLRSATQIRLRSVQPPAALIDSIRATIASAPSPPMPAGDRAARTRLLVPAAAVLTLLAIGAMLILEVFGRQMSPELDLMAELAAAHVNFANDDSRLEVTGDRATVTAWLQERISFQNSVPDVPGFELRGGRIVTFDGQTAGMLVYEDEPTKEYISILTFATPFGNFDDMAQSGDFRVGTSGDVAVAVWTDGELYIALVGKVTRAEVVRLASETAQAK